MPRNQCQNGVLLARRSNLVPDSIASGLMESGSAIYYSVLFPL